MDKKHPVKLADMKIDERPSFAASICCMDGRIQLPIIAFLKKKYGVDYVDIISAPGPIKYLNGNVNHAVVETIKKRVKISAEKHRAKVIAISGHFDCAGNPVDKRRQLAQIEGSVKLVESWGYGLQIIRLWVDHEWKVRVI